MSGIDPYRHDVAIKAAMDAARRFVFPGPEKYRLQLLENAAIHMFHYYNNPHSPHYDPEDATDIRREFRRYHRSIETLAHCARRAGLGEEDGLRPIYFRAMEDLGESLKALYAISPPRWDYAFPPHNALEHSGDRLFAEMGRACESAPARHAGMVDRMHLARQKMEEKSWQQLLEEIEQTKPRRQPPQR